MNIALQDPQDPNQQAASQQAETTQSAESQQQNSVAMEEAAREASLMLLDRIQKESAGEDPDAKPEGETAKAEQKTQTEQKPQRQQKLVTEKKQRAAAKTESAGDDEPVVRAPRGITPEKLAETAADAAAKAAAEAVRQTEEARRIREIEAARVTEADKNRFEVPKELESDVAKLREAQRLNPDAYQGRDLAKEFVDASVKEKSYERDWRRKNPGRQFDWDDEEHSEFVASNAVDVDPDHLKAAETQMEREEAIREAERRFSEKYGKDLEEVRRMRTEAAIEPVRRQVDDAASRALLEAVRPDLSEHFDKDRKKVVDEITADPIAAEVVQAVESWSQPGLDAIVRVINSPKDYSEKSPEVAVAIKTAMKAESVIASVPADERPTTEDGRRFATLKDFNNMPASKRSQYYTIREEELLPQLVIKAAQWEAGQMRESLEKKVEAIAAKRGFVKADAGKKPAPSGLVSQTSPKTETATRVSSAPAVRAQLSDPGAERDTTSGSGGIPNDFWSSIGLPPAR